MFQKTKAAPPELFSGIVNIAGNKKANHLGSPQSMHNIFFSEVVSRVDESIFSVLFDQGNGRPNASIRMLVGMMILKEGEGWTDEQLFGSCQYDLRAMMALGLHNLSDPVPSPSTYYKFKVSVERYDKDNGINLLDKCFKQLTLDQMEYHAVSGKQLRLDSKLIQSNIADNSRLGLLLEGLRVHVSNEIPYWQKTVILADDELLLLEGLKTKKPHRILYSMIDKEQKEMLTMVGYLYQKLALNSSVDSTIYQLYHEQFKEEPSNNNEQDAHSEQERQSISPKDDKELKSDNIQSVHDTDASYRKKNGQKIKGYHTQVTETCSEDNEINLIVDVSTHGANESECNFLQPTVEQVNQMICAKAEPEQVELTIADGGYDSVANREWANSGEHENQIILTKTKGGEQCFEMYYDNEGYLFVKDKKSETQCEVYYSKGKQEKIVIKNNRGNRRYFTWEQINNYMLLQLLSSKVTDKHHNTRANVESTIHQLFCKLERRYKTKYRGKIRTHFYVLSRAFWANFQRINNKLTLFEAIFEYFATATWSALHSLIIVFKQLSLSDTSGRIRRR